MVLLKKSLPLILVLLFSFSAIRPLFISGFFPMHDDTQPTRVYQMAKALSDGQFPVRWVEDLGYGYGYPIFNFYAPFPYYVGAFPILVGFDAITATKIMFVIGIVTAAVSMFFLGKKLWGDLGGMISALFYMYAPYHAIEIYVRGAVGEYWAYAFLPLVVLGVIEAGDKNWQKGILIGSLGFAAVLLSHNITGLLTAGYLIVWLVVEFIQASIRPKSQNYQRAVISVLLLGLGLSAFFWLPAIVEANNTKIHTLIEESNNFRNHFVYADQLWDSAWGYAGSAPGRADGMSFKIGKLHILIGLLGLVCIYLFNKTDKTSNIQKKVLFIFMAVGLVGSLFMMLPLSEPIWMIMPFLTYIQYPWRFLVFVLFFISLLGGALVILIRNWNRYMYLSLSLLIGILIWTHTKYFQPQYISSKTAKDYIEDKVVKWQISKISDEYLPKNFPIPQTESDVSLEKIRHTNDIIIETSEFRSHFTKLTVSAKNQAEIVFSIADFPGWKTVIDSKRVKHQTKEGKIAMTIPGGRHIVTAYFGNTQVRTVANFISLAAITFSLIIVKKMHEKN